MIDLTCCCVHCENNKAFCNTPYNGLNNPEECTAECYMKSCDYRNQPELREAYDEGYKDGYDAAY